MPSTKTKPSNTVCTRARLNVSLFSILLIVLALSMRNVYLSFCTPGLSFSLDLDTYTRRCEHRVACSACGIVDQSAGDAACSVTLLLTCLAQRPNTGWGRTTIRS